MLGAEVSMASAVRQVAESRPAQEALICGDVRVTYSELLDCVSVMARGLHRLGVGKGDKIGILLPPGPEFVTLFFAVASLGAQGHYA